MKTIIKPIFFSLLAVAGVFTGCRETNDMEGEGVLRLRVHISEEVKVVRSSSAVNPDALAANCRVRIYNQEGLIRYYKGLENLPAELWLTAGNYRIATVTGDSVAASFDKAFYRGDETVTIRGGQENIIQTKCKIQNTLVSVAFTDAAAPLLNDYQITVSTTEGELVFTSDNLNDYGYFMMPEGHNEMNWVLTGKNGDGQPFSQNGTIKNVKPATRYALTFDAQNKEQEYGGLHFVITVDESTIEVKDEIQFYQRPQIRGVGYDIAQPVCFEIGGGSTTSVQVKTSAELKERTVCWSPAATLGLPESFNALEPSGEESAALAGKVTVSHTHHAESGRSTATVAFEAGLFTALPEGEYTFTFRATDNNRKMTEKKLTVLISNATLVTEDPVIGSVWARHATLQASKRSEPTGPVTFRYRATGTDEWSVTDQITDHGDRFSATIYGLTPGTDYEYQVADGNIISVVTCRFTTESATQLENAGFERWSGSSPLLVHGDGEAMFWDTGNHGSATLGVNITTNDSQLKHSGRYSAKLSSQYVALMGIGKFAAGNMFTGAFVGTEQTTHGIIDFGRPFTTRPAALKGWYKYNSGKVDRTSTSMLPSGVNDTCHIYVAIGDWDGPVRIRTSVPQLFSSADPKIIAYGELVQGESTSGEGLIEFNIDLEYRDTTRMPKYIVVVASASKYGDYFSGSTQSVLWIDDFELIYE